VEALLKNKSLLSEENIVAPEIILYEVANSVWKHEHLLKDLENGKLYISIFYGLVKAGKITVLSPNESLMQDAYVTAKKNGITIYDAVFVCMAVKLGLPLKTFDKAQAQALKQNKKEQQ
jgi:predicted nucleic acid-binding protein